MPSRQVTQWQLIRLQIVQQVRESPVVMIMLLPLTKIADIAPVTESGGPGLLRLHHGFIQAHWDEHQCVGPCLAVYGRFHFFLDPGTLNHVSREHQQEFVKQASRIIDAAAHLLAHLSLFRGKPATDPFALKVGAESFDKVLVFGGIAEKAGGICNRRTHEFANRGNERISKPCTTQEALWNAAFRTGKRVCPDGRWCLMDNRFESLDRSQINISKDRPSDYNLCEDSSRQVDFDEVDLDEVGPTKVRFDKIAPTEISSAQISSAQISSAQIGSAQIGSAQIGSAQIDIAEVCVETVPAHIGITQVGSGEIGFTEVQADFWTLLSPPIPGDWSLLNQSQMFCVSHSLFLLSDALIITRERRRTSI